MERKKNNAIEKVENLSAIAGSTVAPDGFNAELASPVSVGPAIHAGEEIERKINNRCQKSYLY